MVVGTLCGPIDGLKFVKGDAPAEVPKHGSVTVIELWAQWCGPCRQVFPHLTRIYHERKAQGLIVVGISVTDDPGLQAFVDQQGDKMGYIVAIDQAGSAGQLMKRAKIQGIPHAFIVGRDGKIAYSGHPAEPSFEQAIDQALSAGQEQAREALPQVTASKEQLAAMGVKDLKAILDERKLSYAGITEKSELVDLIDSQCRSITYYK